MSDGRALNDALTLGPFELTEPLQAGGMALIYRGFHRYSGEAAAIKVIRPDQLDRESRRHALRREIQTIAALDHPNIVRLLDVGQTGPEIEAASAGQLPAGAPWYAMELVDGGTLLDAPPARDWEQLERWALELLDALAHAHAAGVVHRDLKPNNILLTPDDQGARIKLVDFGIAQLLSSLEHEELGDETSEINVSGTPRYMAPEQVSGRHREQGPWTDLYALGCVLWFLMCGRPPFEGNLVRVMRAHVFEDLPEFEPLLEIPAGVERWLGRMLAKSPTDRYRRAADAARDLVWLRPEPEPVDVVAMLAAEPTEDPTIELEFDAFTEPLTLLGEDTPDPTASLTTLSFLSGEFTDDLEVLREGFDDLAGAGSAGGEAPRPPSARPRTPPALPAPAPPTPPTPTTATGASRRVPTSWEQLSLPDAGHRATASLELLEVRRPPMVGRTTERDLLWGALREAEHLGRARLALVRAPQGAGATRLALWLARRAHEVGATSNMVARHGEQGDRFDGVRGMLTAALRCSGLSGPGLRRHLGRMLGEGARIGLGGRELEQLARQLDPGSTEAAPLRHAFGLIARVLAMTAAQRPLLLIFDDIDRSAESMGFVEYLLSGGAPAALLVVATVNEDMLETAPGRRAQVENLTRLDGARTVRLGHLRPRDQRALIDSLLPLHEELAEELVRRAEGRPGFAMLLLRDWIERGALIEDREGFHLADSLDALPGDIGDLWDRRIEHVLQGLPAAIRADADAALEVAATLGRRVQLEEWRIACMAAHVRSWPQVLEAMIACGLAAREVESDRWSFTHELLREALLHRIEGEPTRARYERACASALAMLHHAPHARLMMRRAWHHLRGAEPEKAARLLGRASGELERSGAIAGALEAASLRARAIEQWERSSGTVRWCMTQLECAELELELRQVVDARGRLERVRARFPGLREPGHPAVPVALARQVEATHMAVRLHEGRLERIVRGRDALLHALQRSPRDPTLVLSLMRVAQANHELGDLDLARHLYELCQTHAVIQGDARATARALTGAAHGAITRGDFDAALGLVERAREAVDGLDLPREAAEICWILAHVEGASGNDEGYAQALGVLDDLLLALPPSLRAMIWIRRLVLALERAELERAEHAAHTLERTGADLRATETILHQAALGALAAERGDLEEARRKATVVAASVRRATLHTLELAQAMRRLARHLGAPDAPHPLAAMAAAMLTRLGRDDLLER